MADVFNAKYKDQFVAAGLLDGCGGELQHLISDAATMQIIRWTDGGFGMAAHNYDGDMLTDEVSQVHRSPGFITSNLIGKRDDGVMIMEFEASHGTVTDMDEDRLAGKETSLNPLGMVEALLSAMNHAGALEGNREDIVEFTTSIRQHVHQAMSSGNGTRDLCGPTGLTTEQFIDYVAEKI
jgi:isocitrate dehydrogenase